MPVAGPNLPQADFEAAAARRRAHVEIFRFRKDFPSLLAAAELSVSQVRLQYRLRYTAGRLPLHLVPFAAGGETEQTVRAERLQRWGWRR